MDVNTLFAGKDHKFRDLPKNYIIFITDFDCFNSELYQYTFTNKCNEVPGLELGDGTTKIFLNVKGCVAAETRPELIQFLKLIKNTEEESARGYKELEQLCSIIKDLKESNEKEAEFMKLEWQKEAGKEEGIEIGKEEGIEIGKEEGIEIGKELTKKVFKLSLKGFSPEQIAEELNLELQEVNTLLE